MISIPPYVQYVLAVAYVALVVIASRHLWPEVFRSLPLWRWNRLAVAGVAAPFACVALWLALYHWRQFDFIATVAAFACGLVIAATSNTEKAG